MVLQRESDKTTPAIANQDLGDKQLRGTQDTDKGGKQHVTYEVMAQEDEASTSKSEKIYPQGYQQAPPKLMGASGILSVCPIVSLVCSVCQALSIHAHKAEVNTITEFMMISSPLEQHKAYHI